MNNERRGGDFGERLANAVSDLASFITQLTAEGKRRQLVVRRPDGVQAFKVPLLAGLAVTLLLIILLPVVTAFAAVSALIAGVRVENIRSDEPD